jgi:phosphate starvation-inducible PhoH-like protein
MDVIDNSVIAFGIGPAGTGKTFIAVRKALEMLAAKKVKKIVLSRPAKEAAGERLGFLPGDMEQKLHPHLMPIYDIIAEAMGPATLKAMMDNGIIEICPLAFMRGRTFNDAVIVLDEMQNATEDQFKMALTRIGERTTAIVTGDPRQSDLPGTQSGLVPTVEKFKDAPSIAVTRFTKEDIVRSPIVSVVLDYLGE